MTLDELVRMQCRPRKGSEHALTTEQTRSHLDLLSGWMLADDQKGISKEFRFDDFHRTMAFVNAVAWIAHVEDHHPDMKVSYPSCTLYFSTHDVGGLSLNDFICAAKVDHLIERN
ncbi:MAG TPA: 4a-hydroxytetrahydrobiopterin dehydratase [Dokdonella sp.]|nr:4a-hydroxytetrahydrobiopterin dehydratase [Dokdonella sp.]HET9032466.1 4a-hydroxytetrahydrobiopterin dehydratase [Dokdonella sp.]